MIFDFLISSNKKSIQHLRKYVKILETQLDELNKQIQIYEIKKDNTWSHKQTSQTINDESIIKLLHSQNYISSEIIKVKKEIKRQSSKKILLVEIMILPLMILLLAEMSHIVR